MARNTTKPDINVTSELPSDGGNDASNIDTNGGDEGGDIGLAPGIADEAGSIGGVGGTGGGLDPAVGIEPGTRKRRRGSSEGTNTGTVTSARPRTSSKTNKVGLTGEASKLFATQLVGAHKALGLVTGYGEHFEISDQEGETLALAITDVMAQHKIKINPKVAAWSNLLAICGVIYVPKVLLVYAVTKQNKESRPAPAQASDPGYTAPSGSNVGKMTFGV